MHSPWTSHPHLHAREIVRVVSPTNAAAAAFATVCLRRAVQSTAGPSRDVICARSFRGERDRQWVSRIGTARCVAFPRSVAPTARRPPRHAITAADLHGTYAQSIYARRLLTCLLAAHSKSRVSATAIPVTAHRYAHPLREGNVTANAPEYKCAKRKVVGCRGGRVA